MDVINAGSQKVVIWVVLGLIAMGVVFRFVNLDQKIYGHDESNTLVRIAGFTGNDRVKRLFINRDIGIEDIQHFQHPNSERNLMDTVKSVARSDPQLAPLYFVMARLWAEWFGNSPAASKSLPALLSLFAFPCVYWLCRELFGSSLSGWIAMGLLAVSPFHVMYAQEARPYSLLLLSTLLSSAALLRAVRVQSKQSWIIYASSVAFGLYCHLLTMLVFIGHGVYVMAHERYRITRLFVSYAVSVVPGLLAFSPWLVIVIMKIITSEKSMGWTHKTLPFSSMAKAWVGDLTRIFFDSGILGSQLSLSNVFSNPNVALLMISGLAAVTLAIYALWFLWRFTPQRTWLFVFVLIGVTTLPFVGTDLILGRRFSTAGRYLTAAYLGIQLALAFLLAAKISASETDWYRKMWRLIGAVLAVAGIVSCIAISRARVWSNHHHVYDHSLIASMINRSSRPLVIGEYPAHGFFSLVHLLRPETRFRLVKDAVPEISNADRDIFLYRPSETLRKDLEKNFTLENLHERGGLWHLKRREAQLPMNRSYELTS